jgi:hypothetical protein
MKITMEYRMGEDIVIEPTKIKEEFEKVERENYKFRTYLKNHADSDELDEKFLELHNELFKNCEQSLQFLLILNKGI